MLQAGRASGIGLIVGRQRSGFRSWSPGGWDPAPRAASRLSGQQVQEGPGRVGGALGRRLRAAFTSAFPALRPRAEERAG